MTIGPTVAGGLKLVPEEKQDWEVLQTIALDGEGKLSERFGDLMDEDAVWEEIVVPELEGDFSRQREEVAKEVARAKASDEPIHIEKDRAEIWYGALNQARLELEARFKFGPRELRNPGEMGSGEERSAFFRNDFYCTVQSLLLRYVMTD